MKLLSMISWIIPVYLIVGCGDGPLVTLNMTGINASSTLPTSPNYPYDAQNAIDGDKSTAWVEGIKGDGLGESLQIAFEGSAKVKEISVINGFTVIDPQLGDLYFLNNRVKTLRISFDDGEEIVNLKDSNKDYQNIKFSKMHVSLQAKVTIVEVFKGSRWDDTAIGDIHFIGHGKRLPEKKSTTASAGGQSLLKIGSTGRTSKFEITLTSVEQQSSVGQYIGNTLLGEKAPDGAVFIAVSYKLKNSTQEPIGSFSMPSIKLISPEGTKYDENMSATVFFRTAQKTEEKALSDLNPGITIRSGSVFEVSKDLWKKRGWKLLFDADSDVEFAAN